MSRKITVSGEAVIRVGDQSTIEFYEETFVLDDSVVSESIARSMVQGGLIADRLREKNPNFRRWRTCQVESIEQTTEEAPHAPLDKLLLEATQLGCVPENINNYKRPDYKMTALQKAIQRHKDRAVPKDELEKVD